MIERKTRNLDKLIAKIEQAKKNNVKSGYFKESGKHSEALMPYGHLMYLHEFGFHDYPDRPVRNITMASLDKSFVMREIKEYLRGKQRIGNLLDHVGWKITTTARGVFGNPDLLEHNSAITIRMKGTNTPLVDNGELRNAWSWKTTVENYLKNISDGRG